MALALGIETSCDDCSVSVAKHTGEVLFLSQRGSAEWQEKFGGIVPEAAARQHDLHLLPLIEEALRAVPLSKIDLIAVCSRPGLLGSLLAGAVAAKTLSWVWGKPLIGINHIEAHLFSPGLFFKEAPPRLLFPALGFAVSGGHSALFAIEGPGRSRLLGETRDDAAGEAFDKFARMLGFSYPGGPFIDKMAQGAKIKESFFSPIKTDDLSFSFSGLKSQAKRLIDSQSLKWVEERKASLSADYQKTIVDHLMEKLDKAFQKNSYKQILVGGGVSANSLFRSRLKSWAAKKAVPCLLPATAFCADNGAMIAFMACQYFEREQGFEQKNKLKMPCSPRHLKEDFF